jgi:hypothetical protein
MPSLKDWWQKINTADWWLVAVVILVGSLGFGLGRLTQLATHKTPVKLEWPTETSQGVTSPPRGEGLEKKAGAGEVVASSKGKKYHYPNCPSAKTISPTNLIHFDSAAAAEAAGYTLAANCKPS